MKVIHSRWLGFKTWAVGRVNSKANGKDRCRPILWHIMNIYSYFGFNDFIIALGVKGEVIKDYFYNYRQINNDFTVDLNL